MKQNILFTYTEEYLPTPCCRNNKTREVTASVCVNIKNSSLSKFKIVDKIGMRIVSYASQSYNSIFYYVEKILFKSISLFVCCFL